MDEKPTTANEALLVETLGNVYLLKQETKALLDSVQLERDFLVRSLQTERNEYKNAFDTLKSFIESQNSEMEIIVTACVRAINEATLENAKTIADQLEKKVSAQTSEHGNAAKTFFDKNTAQSLEAINQANIKAKNDIETRRNQLVGSINTDFLSGKVRGWFVIWSLMATITLGIVLYASHKYLNDTIRDEIWQATAQFSKTKH